jgi:UDP:flavonoid glycosyltransferase YjiC (YdhE family)
MIDIADELAQRGVTVRFLGHEGQRSTIEGRGFEFEPFSHARPWSVLQSRPALTGALDYAAVFSDRGMARDVRESVQRRPVDLALIDGLLIGAMHGAAAAGLPYSVLAHSLLSVMDTTLNRGPLAAILRVKGLHPRRLYAQAESILVVTLAALDTAAESGDPRIHHTGPTVSSAPARPETPPVVLVSLSTTYIAGQSEVLQRVIDALAELPVHGIVTTGPAVDPTSLRATTNVEVHGVVPHAQLMPRASVVVGHGGHATTMQALAAGVPLLILPMNPTFDQPTIGARVAAAGAGLTLPKGSSAVDLRGAIERILGDDRFRAAAESVGAGIRESRGAKVAAAALVASLSARIPGRLDP